MKVSLGLLLLCWIPFSAEAQLIPDRSLGGENSTVREQVIQSLPSTLIEGGAQRNSRLFHSFEKFSVDAGRGAFFANPAGITQIITRITGGGASQLNGTLGVLGPADLILINPSGIQFGPTARLNIAGSFLATTADRVEFDQWNFEARNPQPVPLLTVSAPIGLGFLSGTPGAIQVEGVGHQLNLLNGFSPVVGAGQQIGLTGGIGRSFALIGGDVSFKGGVITAPSGDISVGSIQQGRVAIRDEAGRWQFDYSQAAQLQNITLQRLSLLDASGVGSAGINLIGNQIYLIDGSFVLLQNQGLSPAGPIQIHAQQDLTVVGDSPNPVVRSIFLGSESKSGVLSETFLGRGSNINVEAASVNLMSAGGLRTTTFGGGNGGDLSVSTSQATQINGYSFRDSRGSISLIQTVTFADGKAGNLSLHTSDLSVTDGGEVLSGTQGAGSGGTLSVVATRTVAVQGTGDGTTFSVLSTGSIGAGNAGNLSITAPVVNILDGGQIGASSAFSGSSGSVSIFADQVIVSGGFFSLASIQLPSLISAAAFPSPVFQAFGLPTPPLSADSGTVAIVARELRVSDGAQIRVLNLGTGNAGSIQLNVDRLLLNNGSLSAATSSGQGGNIEVQAARVIVLRQGSSITATAAGQGLGGNITVWTPALAVLNSRINADAQFNLGGQIFVSTQGFFRSKDSSITATSQLGPQFSGVVQIAAPDVDLSRSTRQEEAPASPPQLSSACNDRQGQSSFRYTGSGGTPLAPEQTLSNQRGWRRGNTSETSQGNSVPAALTEKETQEAQGWVRTAEGRVRFVVQSLQGMPSASSLSAKGCDPHAAPGTP